MLRLIHEQTVIGALLVDDIDDGLPNKQVKRLGSTANPDAYARDGYANASKQSCYVPRTNPSDPTLPGFIDLDETQRVTHSAFSGKIKGFQDAGFISIVSLDPSDLERPEIASGTLDAPEAGDVTIDGAGFLSVAPDTTTVRLFGPGVGDVTLSESQIIAAAPGSVSAIQIVIDSTLVPSLASGDSIVVKSNGVESGPRLILP